MPSKASAIKLPDATGSLTGLSQSGPLLLRVDGSNSNVLLIDLSGKKPTFREVASTGGPRMVTAGVFSADGQHLVLLCTDDSQEHPARVEVLAAATGTLVSSFELALTKPREIWAHPDGERIYVSDDAQTVCLSKTGEVLETFPLLESGSSRDLPRFAFNNSGSHALFGEGDGFTVKALGKKKSASFEARDATWLDEDSVLARVRVGDRSTGRMELHRVDAANGKMMKRLVVLPELEIYSVDSFQVRGTRAALSFSSVRRAAFGKAGKTTLHLLQVDLSTGKSTVADIAGRPSGSRVCVGPEATFVVVNMQKVLHVFPH